MTNGDTDETPMGQSLVGQSLVGQSIVGHATMCPHCEETLFDDETCESVDCATREERIAAERTSTKRSRR
jgi:hypothetical protein